MDTPQTAHISDSTSSRRRTSLPAPLFTLAVLITVGLLALYAVPLLMVRWRLLEAQAEAEAAYLKRRAELKAEAEHADQRLQLLDKRSHLVSLGFREVVRLVTPKVVNVTSFREPGPFEPDGLARPNMIFDSDKGKHYIPAGVGSGLIVKPGLILTNHHVIRNSAYLRVTFASGQAISLEPTAVAADPLTDLAVLRLPSDPPADLKPDFEQTAEFADSDKDVQRGDLVLAVGSPLGLKHTVTHGVISAKGRLLSMLDLVELIQTDAPINPGNSGGPLFDQYGRVAGINVAIASETGGNQGIGFAIPSNIARDIFKALAEKGEVVRGFIGVGLEELTSDQARKLGLDRNAGVLVTRVMPGLAAAKAGLKVGDVIVAYNNNNVAGSQPLRNLRQRIIDTPVGSQVPVTIQRNGQRQTLTVEIGRRPNDLQ